MKTENPSKPNERLAEDLIHGVKGIAFELGMTEREAFYQIEAGNIPVTRMGRKIIGSRSVLKRRFVPEV